MGGCWSQQSIDNETMLAEHDPCSMAERSAGDEVVVPGPGGSSEYVGAYMENGMVLQNTFEPTFEPTLLHSEDQTEQPMLRVSPNVYQNSTEPMFDFPIEKSGRTNVDQPIIYQPLEEQPLVEETVYEFFEEHPQALPVSNQVEEPRPPVSSKVNYEHQNGDEAVLDAPIETTVKPIVDEPLYQPVEIDEQTFNTQIIEEQPVVEAMPQIFEELVDAPSFGEHSVPAESSEIPASTEVYETIQVEETQPAGVDVGVVFEGRTYSTRVFDRNLKEYVYVSGHNVQPRGGLVMWLTAPRSER